MTRSRALWKIGFLLIALAPGGPAASAAPPAPASAPPASAAPASASAAREALLPAPLPRLEGLETAVAEQLRALEDQVRELRAERPEPTAALAGAYGELGMAYHAYSFAPAAAAAYARAGELAPEEPRWPYYQALLAQADGRFDDAGRLYERALALAPELAPALFHLGEVRLAESRLDESETLLGRALALVPGDAAILGALGQVALARPDAAAAVRRLEAALAAAPAANRFHYPLGLAYRALGDLDRARDHLARRGEVGAQVKDAWWTDVEGLRGGERVHLIRGRVAFRAGRLAEAAAELEKAVAENPASVPARVNWSAALAGLGETDKAIAQLDEVLRLAPDNPTARYNLGVMWAQQGDLDKAASYLAPAVAADPRDAEAALRLGEVRERQGRSADALALYQSAIESAPGNEQGRLAEASLLVRLGRYAEARVHLEEGLALLPTSGRLTLALARFLAANPKLELRDGKRAVELATRALSAQASADNAETLALALAEAGDCAAAARWQGQVVTTLEGAAAEVGAARIAAAKEALQRYTNGPSCRP